MISWLGRPRPIFTIVFGVALLARATAALLTAVFSPYRIGGDATLYDELARSLLAGRGLEHAGHQSAIVGPVYPAFLALAYAAGGGSIVIAQLAQAVAGSAAAGLVALIGYMLAGRAAALAGGLILAVYPPIVLWTVQLLTENAFIPLTIASLFVLIRASLCPTSVRFAVAGLVLGICALARPEAVAFVPFAAAAVVWIHRRRGAALALIFAAVASAPVALWITRNAVAIGAPTLTTEGGAVLWMGYGPDAGERHHDGYAFSGDAPPGFPAGTDEAAADAAFRDAALRAIEARPMLPLELLPAKAVNMFRPVWGGSRFATYVAIGGSWLALVALTGIGAIRGGMRREIAYVYLFAVAIVGVHLLTISEIRYRLPLEAALTVPAGAGGVELVAAATRRWRARAVLTL